MPIPSQSKIYKPLLHFLSQHKAAPMREVIEAMANLFQLTEEERNEVLPSGSSKRFDSRVQWAKLGLAAAKLLDTPERGIWSITERGRKALEHPGDLNRAFLRQYPEYLEWRAKSTSEEKGNDKSDEAVEDNNDTTPQEVLEESYQTLRDTLAGELLERVKASSPQFFESLVVDLLVAMGYGGSRKDAGQAVGQSGDDGIDGIIKEDILGLDVIYIQAKRWQNTVGRPEVQAFAGSLEGVRARKGVFITTSRFTKEALEYVTRIEKKIILMDGKHLTHLMIEHGIGVSEVNRYIVKKVDLDYFEPD